MSNNLPAPRRSLHSKQSKWKLSVGAGLCALVLLAACGNATPDPYANLPQPTTTSIASTDTSAVVTESGSTDAESTEPDEDIGITTSSSPISIPPETPRKVLQVVYQKAILSGWKDVGWDPTRSVGSGPARIDLGNGGGWLLSGRPPAAATGLEFRYRTAKEIGPVIRIILGNQDVENVGREVRLNKVRPDADGWVNIRIPLYQLNPKGLEVSQIRFAPRRRLRSPSIVEIDDFVFTQGGSMDRYGSSAGIPTPTPSTLPRPTGSGPNAPRVKGLKPGFRFTTTQNLTVDCKSDNKPISQLIYGIGWVGAGNQPETPWDLYPGANRWGGNPTSRYNWENGNAWNTANDYFFRNVQISDKSSNAMEQFLSENEKHQVPSAVSVPTLGWVAKDAESFSFPVFDFGAQQQTDPEIPEAGNGKDTSGQPVAPGSPKRTSVASTPESITAWVEEQLKNRVTMYFLDNEPDLWDSTHRDVRPQPLGYDELLQNTIDYAAAIRKVEPKAIIAGPSSWGWPGYFYSAVDAAAGFDKAPDRNAHGGLPLIPWYLKAMRTYEKKNKVKLLDLLDVHYYPAAEGLYTPFSNAKSTPEIAAKRIRATRALWDSSYVDESWVGEPVRLLPRLRDWIDRYAPGLGISIGEWSFGGETEMSGGLAVAETLGQFGNEGVTSAYYWTAPPKNSEAFWGFRAYRNYDGKGSNFNGTSIRAIGFKDAPLSAFASQNESGGEATLVLLNTSPTKDEASTVQFFGCRRLDSYQTFVYSGGPKGFVEEPELGALNDSLSVRLPKYSITVLRARFR
jgi:Glycoside hydrolase family 44